MALRFYARLSPLLIIVVLLFAGGLGIAAFKALYQRVPVLPEMTTTVWTVEAEVAFRGKGGSSKIEFRLPEAASMRRVIDENFVSRSYGLSLLESGTGPREATWTLRQTPKRKQSLYYQVKVLPGAVETAADVPTFPPVPDYKEPLASAITAVLDRAREQSADIFSFTEQLLLILNDPTDENVKVIHNVDDRPSWQHLVAEILAGARIPTRIAYGIPLGTPIVDGRLVPWLEVHNGERWRGYNADTGAPGYPPNFFIWRYDSPELVVKTRGVRDVDTTFSTIQTRIAQADLHSVTGPSFDGQWFGVDLAALPVQTQNLFRVLLMIPVGAVIVAFLRVVVGVPTFGTFMPILIALAFRETQLLWGVTLFLALILVGLSVRLALARLRLLLVPRLSAMLVVVVCLMLGITVLSFRLGIEQGLSIALFPMVILAMTIERMSITWEERGALGAAKETVGSLVVAICGYFAMNEPHLQHLMFYFPELLMVLLALTLMLGAYSGYRVSELIRFKALQDG
jgi:hypothetical protein